MNTFALVCSRCGVRQPFALKGVCSCGGTLLVEFDTERISLSLRDEIQGRPWTMWRYKELLPVSNISRIVTLGEGGTPLLRLERLEKRFGLGPLYSKREELNPTGSFKARGFSSAVTLLNERDIRKVAVNSNGNAASALAAYAAGCGMDAYVFVPKDCPGLIVEECLLYGAHTYLVNGFIQDAGAIVAEGASEQGWFHVGTLKEPGRVEGKKTMGLEIAEQLGWKFPDIVIYPTGGGSGIIGLWRAFLLLKELGWVQGPLPRLISVQEQGCEPVVHRFGGRDAQVGEEHVTASATGLRVPKPPDIELVVSILQQTNGHAVSVSLSEIEAAVQSLGRYGLSASPEGAATWAALLKLKDEQRITAGETIVLFNTSHAGKYMPWKVTQQTPVITSYHDFRYWHSRRS
ncbi:threonine synthase [Paenibacillus rigui]|uniref:Threonine synthase n=1 Tax=Paenibacillus rigui TaxID=554312 RepID=A0A229UPY3_9BACL|nr:threonine synthase [Paenibacillus rigui]OXM85424.1 threonine synthase [Paenibacillus rigui]